MTHTAQHHTGSGLRVLLLHSGCCTWVEWRRLIALLEPDHEVLAPTQPGSAGGPALLDDDRTVLAVELANRGRATTTIALAPPWLGQPLHTRVLRTSRTSATSARSRSWSAGQPKGL